MAWYIYGNIHFPTPSILITYLVLLAAEEGEGVILRQTGVCNRDDACSMQSLDTQYQRNFPSLDSALNALGSINMLNLPPEYLEDIDALTLQVRSELDLYALPTPMRPGALLSNKWQLSSPWKEAVWP